MRGSDLYTGLVALTLAFGALVVGLEGSPWYGPATLLAASGIAWVLMVRHSMQTPKVLLVGDPAAGRLLRLQDALDEQGFRVTACAGPARKACPVFAGQPCPFDDHLAAAVIANPASYHGAAPPCGSALGIVTMTVEDGSDQSLFFGRRSAFVGSAAGPAKTAEAVRELLDTRR